MYILTRLIFASFSFIHCSNILAVFPVQSKSHYSVISPVMQALADRSHKVTVYTPYPKTHTNPNLKDVDISACFKIDTTFQSIDSAHSISINSFSFALMLLFFGTKLEDMEECQPLKNLLNSTEKYDLFFTETFVSDTMLMLGHKFQVPYIAFMPNAPFPWLADRMANPANPSYIVNMLMSQIPPMNFFQRVKNTLLYILMSKGYEWLTMKSEEKIVQHYLGSSAPSMSELVKNTSLIFVNTHESISQSVPLVPAIIPIAGTHISDAKPLPKDIEKFINESIHGVVYFCMGSLLQGASFSTENRNAFMYAFSKIKQRVLWKWEGDELPGQSSNIMISKWMPQRDILAHPNVKLFISHGGLLGTSEAVYEGVPVLGIPIFGDQRTNIRSLEAQGVGELLEYEDISKEVVLERIQRLLNDPKYSKNAEELSFRYKDRPMSPLDTAVYWTEYVIRHKGAPHLKTSAVNMPLYQYLLLDVIGFLILISVSIIMIFYYCMKLILKLFCSFMWRKYQSNSSVSNKKVKHN